MTHNIDVLIDIQEAARLLGVTDQTIRRWEREGRILSVRRGKGYHRKFRLSDVETLANPEPQSNPVPSATHPQD